MSRASKEDLAFGKARERRAAELLVQRLWPGATLIENTTYAHIDWMVAVDGKLVAALEVKARRNSSTAFPDTIAAWEKHDAGRFLKKFFAVRTLMLIVFTDRAGYCHLDEAPDGKRWIGREDRGGSGKDHALYALDRFTWVEGLKEELDQSLTEPDTAE